MVSSLISSVSGIIEGVGPDWADVSLGAITLRVNVPGPIIDSMGTIGDHVRLHTSLQVREDSLTLFGFLTQDERRAFDTLLGISGIGPRLALAVLSRFTPGSLAAAVDAGDTKAFSAVPGVGNRTASRIILELKGKLDLDWGDTPAVGGDPDAVDALVALGYSDPEARQALSNIPRDGSLSTEDKIRLGLQNLAGG
jgi:Holliday junction DNA helicase RuvA